MINHYIVKENILSLLFTCFITEEILKRHIKDCFKINGKKRLRYLRNVKFKNFERKIKSPFMIYADFQSILVAGDNGKQNPNESYTNKYKKYIALHIEIAISMLN